MKDFFLHKAFLFLFLFGIYANIVHKDILAQTAISQEDSLHAEQSIFDLNPPLHFPLQFDVRKFIKSKLDDVKIPAILSYHKSDSITISQEIKIEARGQSRKEICYFPPIKLKLKNVFFQDTYLDQSKNHKLVTHCKTPKAYEQNLLKEYLVYKLYGVLTERSFRVQLIEMNYIDSKGKVKPFIRYAFLIENTQIMCDRNDCVEVESEKLQMRHVEKSSMMQFSLFQFMIGNVDWTIPKLHNIKLMKLLDFKQGYVFVVPYDFDYSGLVDAPYACNVRDVDIESVKTRVFAGLCYSKEDYQVEIEKFIQSKEDFYKLIDSFDELDARNKKEIFDYLDRFYKMIEQVNCYKKYILPHCSDLD